VSLLADALEALIGAVYRDGGFNKAREFILKHFAREIRAALRQEEVRDYKSLLQEKSQKRHNTPPVYRVIDTEGPHHDRTFSVKVLVNDQVMGTGKGKSKKEAEQAAASVALKALENNDSGDS
jgi:ribonuclease-3